MGRTTRFSFPVPGRKQKAQQQQQQQQQPADAIISAPLSKAHKILGAGELNVGYAGNKGERPRGWETRSNSGISITVSESTCSRRTSDAGLGVLTELDEDSTATMYAEHAWDDESAVLPPSSHNVAPARSPKPPSSRKQAALLGSDYGDTTGELHRRESGSTIRSFYDKAKMPLSISQQTSSSAMAMGLPKRESRVADTNTPPAERDKPKKKAVTRLDLSNLFPRHRKQDQAARDEERVAPSRGRDYVASPPAIAPALQVQSPVQESTGLRRRFSRLRSNTQRQPDPPPDRLVRDKRSLDNLYKHYEEMSFREFALQSVNEHSPTASSTDEPEAEQEPIQQASSDEESIPLVLETPSTPTKASNSNLQVPGAAAPHPVVAPSDCGASISSRHTRTSRASRRTDRSVFDSDLQQRSVLSLSSDSEDDAVPDRPPKSAPSNPSGNDTDALHTSPGPRRPATSHRPVILERTSSRNALVSLGQIMGPAAAPRSQMGSRLSMASIPTQASASLRPTSRLSMMSTSTTASAIDFRKPIFSPSPKALASIGRLEASTHQFMSEQVGFTSALIDQPTPPISPISGEFAANSVDAATMSAPRNSARLIAVTHQEEMLLAALRNKRARMRQSALNDLEGDMMHQDLAASASRHLVSGPDAEGQPSSSAHSRECHPVHPQRQSRLYPDSSSSGGISSRRLSNATTASTVTVDHAGAAHTGSQPMSPNATSASRSKGKSNGSDMRGRSHSNGSQHHYQLPADMTVNPPAGPSKRHNRRGRAREPPPFPPPLPPTHARRRAAAGGGGPLEDRVLVYLGRRKPSLEEDVDLSEPSPDLSDFISLDNSDEYPLASTTDGNSSRRASTVPSLPSRGSDAHDRGGGGWWRAPPAPTGPLPAAPHEPHYRPKSVGSSNTTTAFYSDDPARERKLRLQQQRLAGLKLALPPPPGRGGLGLPRKDSSVLGMMLPSMPDLGHELDLAEDDGPPKPIMPRGISPPPPVDGRRGGSPSGTVASGTTAQSRASSLLLPIEGRRRRAVSANSERLRAPPPAEAEAEPVTPTGSVNAKSRRVSVVESGESGVEGGEGVPRPDSPISPLWGMGLPLQGAPIKGKDVTASASREGAEKRRAGRVRLSAIGNVGMEAALWNGDD